MQWSSYEWYTTLHHTTPHHILSISQQSKHALWERTNPLTHKVFNMPLPDTATTAFSLSAQIGQHRGRHGNTEVTIWQQGSAVRRGKGRYRWGEWSNVQSSKVRRNTQKNVFRLCCTYAFKSKHNFRDGFTYRACQHDIQQLQPVKGTSLLSIAWPQRWLSMSIFKISYKEQIFNLYDVCIKCIFL